MALLTDENEPAGNAEPIVPANAGRAPRFQAEPLGPAWLDSAFAMKILKWIPVALTAVHGGLSVMLLGISHLMPMGGFGGAIGHITALLAFVLNLPGVLTLKQFYTSSPSDGPFSVFLGSLGMIVITDIYVLLLLTVVCVGIGKAMKWANKTVEATADPQGS